MEEVQTETKQPSLIRHATKVGGILGAASIVLLFLVYMISFPLIATIKFAFLLFLLGMGIVVWGGIDHRKQIGGYMPYGQAYVFSFVTFITAGILSTIFNMVLYNVIDPALPEKISEVMISNTEEMLHRFNAPDSRIDETLDEMRNGVSKQFSPGGLLLGYVKGLIWWAIISLIAALFIRKDKPVEKTT